MMGTVQLIGNLVLGVAIVFGLGYSIGYEAAEKSRRKSLESQRNDKC